MLTLTPGTGKTFIIQSIADMLGSKLVVINLNQQVPSLTKPSYHPLHMLRPLVGLLSHYPLKALPPIHL